MQSFPLDHSLARGAKQERFSIYFGRKNYEEGSSIKYTDEETKGYFNQEDQLHALYITFNQIQT